MQTRVIAALVLGSISNLLLAQTRAVSDLKLGDKPAILFAAEVPSVETDQNDKPVPQLIEPIAFIVGGQLRQCDGTASEKESTAARSAVLDRLRQAYAPGRQYPLWHGGARWGQAEVVKSCIDEDINLLAACVYFKGAAPRTAVQSGFRGISYTAPPPVASHAAQKEKAGDFEKTTFVAGVSGVLRNKQIRVPDSRIKVAEVWKTRLRADHLAIAGNVLVQIPARKPGTHHSYRVFAVLEEANGRYKPVLTSIHNTVITADGGMTVAKPGEELDEGENTDREEFFDNFPLFPGEPDTVITRHYYYEDWSFSIYRWSNGLYQLVYTGCGGGI